MARAYVKAIKYMNAFPDDVAQLVRPLFATTADAVFKVSFESVKNGFPATPSIAAADAKQMIDFSSTATGKTVKVAPDSVVAPAIVERAAKELAGWQPTK
jgi:hypothetical protein